MKKFNEIIITGVLLGITLLPINTHAASVSIVGCNYGLGDINTESLAKYVKSRFSNDLHFSNIYDVYSPNRRIIERETSNGNHFLESDVLYFAGHSNKSNMLWDKCTNEKVGIRAHHEDYGEYVGVGRYNLSRVKFVMLEGCLTGVDSGSIASYFVKSGAKTSIGWSTEINTISGKSWLTNFWDKINSGATVKEANDFANSKSYMSSSIKNTVIYGDQSQRLNNLNYYSTKKISNISTKKLKDNVYIINEKTNTNLKNQIEQIIQGRINPNFNSMDFEYEINYSNDYKIVDFIFNVNGINAEIGYTIFIEDDIITKIFDNTNSVNLLDLKSELKNYQLKKDNDNDKIVYDLKTKEVYRLIESISIDKASDTKKIDYIKSAI